MPSHYAHHRFGRELLPLLPGDARQCISRFRRMYDAGLQGPDIFFYHYPFWKTRQGDLGNLFHNQSGQVFFANAAAAARSEAAQAYLWGLLGHYCLDSACHPYVTQLVDIGEVRHIALEAEFDRFLMARDGIASPHTYDMSGKLRLTRGECATAAALYPGATPGGVSSSLRFLAFAIRFFAGGSRESREALLKRVKPGFCEFFRPTAEVASWRLYTGELMELYAEARNRYPSLLEELREHIRTGEALGDAFAPTFD